MPLVKDYLSIKQVDEILDKIMKVEADEEKITSDASKLAAKLVVVLAQSLRRALEENRPNAKEAFDCLVASRDGYVDYMRNGSDSHYLELSAAADKETIKDMYTLLAGMFGKLNGAMNEALEEASRTVGYPLPVGTREDLQSRVQQIRTLTATEPTAFGKLAGGLSALVGTSKSKDTVSKELDLLLQDIEKMLGEEHVDSQAASPEALHSLAEKSKDLQKHVGALGIRTLDSSLKALHKSLEDAEKNTRIKHELRSLSPPDRQPQSEKPEPPVKQHTFESSSQTGGAGVADAPTSQAGESKYPAQPPAPNAEEAAPPVEANPAEDASLKSTARAKPTTAPRKPKVPLPKFLDEKSAAKFGDKRSFFEEKQRQQQEPSRPRSPKP